MAPLVLSSSSDGGGFEEDILNFGYEGKEKKGLKERCEYIYGGGDRRGRGVGRWNNEHSRILFYYFIFCRNYFILNKN